MLLGEGFGLCDTYLYPVEYICVFFVSDAYTGGFADM